MSLASSSSSSSSSSFVIESKSELLYKNLLRFYKNHPEYKNTMLSIITGKSTVSLRIIDWFVTNYAKQFGTEYFLKSGSGSGAGTLFRVNVSYKLQLKSYGKSEFDPFCRSVRVRIPYNETSEVETTIGQLNFFKWVLENEILDFIVANYEKINIDMQKRGSGSLKRQAEATSDDATGPKTRKKRRELSVSAIKRITRKDVEIVLRFNEHESSTVVSNATATATATANVAQ